MALGPPAALPGGGRGQQADAKTRPLLDGEGEAEPGRRAHQLNSARRPSLIEAERYRPPPGRRLLLSCQRLEPARQLVSPPRPCSQLARPPPSGRASRRPARLAARAAAAAAAKVAQEAGFARPVMLKNYHLLGCSGRQETDDPPPNSQSRLTCRLLGPGWRRSRSSGATGRNKWRTRGSRATLESIQASGGGGHSQGRAAKRRQWRADGFFSRAYGSAEQVVSAVFVLRALA